MSDPHIVFEEYGTVVVRLSEAYEDQKHCILNAALSLKHGISLVRMKSDGRPKKFTLNKDEMNALCNAWADLQAKQEAKDKSFLEKVHAFVVEHPSITTRKVRGEWEVSVPSLEDFIIHPIASSPEELLEHVQYALEVLERRRHDPSTSCH